MCDGNIDDILSLISTRINKIFCDREFVACLHDDFDKILQDNKYCVIFPKLKPIFLKVLRYQAFIYELNVLCIGTATHQVIVVCKKKSLTDECLSVRKQKKMESDEICTKSSTKSKPRPRPTQSYYVPPAQRSLTKKQKVKDRSAKKKCTKQHIKSEPNLEERLSIASKNNPCTSSDLSCYTSNVEVLTSANSNVQSYVSSDTMELLKCATLNSNQKESDTQTDSTNDETDRCDFKKEENVELSQSAVTPTNNTNSSVTMIDNTSTNTNPTSNYPADANPSIDPTDTYTIVTPIDKDSSIALTDLNPTSKYPTDTNPSINQTDIDTIHPLDTDRSIDPTDTAADISETDGNITGVNSTPNPIDTNISIIPTDLYPSFDETETNPTINPIDPDRSIGPTDTTATGVNSTPNTIDNISIIPTDLYPSINPTINPIDTDPSIDPTATNAGISQSDANPTDTNISTIPTDLYPSIDKTDTNPSINQTDINIDPTDTNLTDVNSTPNPTDLYHPSIDQTETNPTDTNPSINQTDINIDPTDTNADANLTDVNSTPNPTDTNISINPTDLYHPSIDQTETNPTDTNPSINQTDINIDPTNTTARVSETDANVTSVNCTSNPIDTNISITPTDVYPSIEQTEKEDMNVSQLYISYTDEHKKKIIDCDTDDEKEEMQRAIENISRKRRPLIKNTRNDNSLFVSESKDTSQRSTNLTENAKNQCQYDTECDKEDSSQLGDWEDMFDEKGELHTEYIGRILKQLGCQVKVIKATNDYSAYESTKYKYEDLEHVIELYDFPPTLKTQDIMQLYRDASEDSMYVKWCDDTHCLLVLSTPAQAQRALQIDHEIIKSRPLECGSAIAIVTANSTDLKPAMKRPQTNMQTARRLINRHLGTKPSLSKEDIELERQALRDAREQRRLERQSEKDAWEGNPRNVKS